MSPTALAGLALALGAALPACRGASARELELLRADFAALRDALLFTRPELALLLLWDDEIVEARDVEEMREQLGDVAEGLPLPEDLDFGSMRDWGVQRWGLWKPPPDEERPRIAFGQRYFREDETHFRRCYEEGAGPERVPTCDELFAMNVVDVWPAAGCDAATFQRKFEELRLRAIAEAMLVCHRNDLCHLARPERLLQATWWCDAETERLGIYVAFRCHGD